MADLTIDLLLEREHAGWRSLCESRGDEFYGRTMTEDGVMALVDGSVLDRDDVIRSLAGAPAWESYEIDDVRMVETGRDSAALVYRARAVRQGSDPLVALMSSVYRLVDAEPRLALYQQTAIVREGGGAPSSSDAQASAPARSSAVTLIRSERLSDAAEYAYASTAPADARPLFLAGSCPLDADGATVGVGDYAVQAARCVENLRTALDDAGAALEDVVSTRVLVASTRQDDLVTAWEVVRDAFGAHDVPSTLMGVTVLGYDDQLVEVEAVAMIRERPA